MRGKCRGATTHLFVAVPVIKESSQRTVQRTVLSRVIPNPVNLVFYDLRMGAIVDRNDKGQPGGESLESY